MTIKDKSKHFLQKALVIALCLCMFMLSGCSGEEETGVLIKKHIETRNTVTMPSENAGVHYAESVDSFSEKAAASGFVEMRIDPESNSFCIYETTKSKVWSALPLLNEVASGEALTSNASTIALTVSDGADIYILNSQDNSVAYGTSTYKLLEDGAEFIYDIYTDETTAKKQALEKTDIAFRVTLTVRLADGSMYADCTYSNLSANPDAYIESIEILNGFGAFNNTHKDDFLLVPDGSGAIIKTATYDESFEPLTFSVYGNDPSTGIESDGTAIVPAFGIKHGDSAFVALIQKGDAVACISADKATSISEYNKVYSSFNVTPAAYKKRTVYSSRTSALNEISLCYRFLSGKNATYAGLASACREQLIRNSVLSTKSADISDYLPFCLTLTGAAENSFGPFTYLKKLTTFEQAQDMLVRMKNKGINNVSVRYSGIFSGGLDSESIENSHLLSRLGGKNKLSELYSYITSQKMSLYLDINLLSTSGNFNSGNAMSIDKNDSVFTPDSYLKNYLNNTQPVRKLRKLSSLPDVVATVLKNTKNLSFSGYCINDAGSILYSDFSHGGLLREDASIQIAKSIVPLSTDHSTMTSNGNFYMLKNIDSIVNLPLKSSVSESGAYASIPFVQLILHGIVDYAGEPVNTSINSDELLLRCIEYGACPHYEWNYEPVTDTTETDIFYYDNTINTAAEFYTKANEALNDLRNARITDHYEVENGVFCTEYDTGTMIYVNYTDSDCTVLGAVVEARNFIRIN